MVKALNTTEYFPNGEFDLSSLQKRIRVETVDTTEFFPGGELDISTRDEPLEILGPVIEDNRPEFDLS